MSLSETPMTGPEGPESPPLDSSPAAPLPAAPIPMGRLWAFAMAGAIAAGLASFAAFEATPTPFHPPKNMVRMMGNLVNSPKAADIAVAERKNAMVAFGVVGALLAGALGVAGGLGRRSARSCLLGALAGLILGAGAGVGAAAVGVRAYYREYDRDQMTVTKDLAIPLMIHAGIWAAVGAAAGAALGIGAGARGRLPSVVLGGLVGGAMGGALYEVAAALVSPAGRTYEPIAAHWAPRLIAALAGPILATVVAVSGLTSPVRRTRTVAAITEDPS